MKDYIFQRKIARIISIIAERQGVSENEALKSFYASRTCKLMHTPEIQLHTMSDLYIVDEFFLEQESSKD